MSEPRARRPKVWWIGTGLTAALLLVALRVGLPVYRRMKAIEAAIQIGRVPVVVEQARDWTPEWLIQRGISGFAYSPFDRFEGFDGSTWVRSGLPSGMDARRARTGEFLIRLRDLNEVGGVSLAYTDFLEADLRCLNSLPQLTALSLAATPVTNAGLAHIGSIVKLTELDLSQTEIGDDGLAHLSKLTKLEILLLDGTHVTDAGLKNIRGLTSLRELSVSATGVTPSGLEELMESIPALSVTDD